MRVAAYAVVAVLVVCSSTVLAEAPIPDLKGTWKAEVHGLIVGKNLYLPKHDAEKPKTAKFQGTVTIDLQEGPCFSGVKKSKHHAERFVGIVSYDGKSLYYADNDGNCWGKVISPTKIELYYLHARKGNMAALRSIWTKQ